MIAPRSLAHPKWIRLSLIASRFGVLPKLAILTTGPTASLDMSQLNISAFVTSEGYDGKPTSLTLSYGSGWVDQFSGDFQYDSFGKLASGTLTAVTENYQGAQVFNLSNFSIDVGQLLAWQKTGDTASALTTILSGADTLTGAAGADRLRGYDGADSISGGGGQDDLAGDGGDDSIFGGGGDDSISDSAGSNYLRGEEGNDVIQGGANFDDINGNQGNDTAHGNDGDDWVVGGKDSDLLFGDAGVDLVLGNLGDDTCDGGSGDDVIRGGQGNDVLFGGAGNDYVSGDRGDDTEAGGAGADLFHGFQECGVDRVLDFSADEGDRVMLDPGTTYTTSQQGDDTVVDMGGGNQIILLNVKLSTLPAGWIFIG